MFSVFLSRKWRRPTREDIPLILFGWLMVATFFIADHLTKSGHKGWATVLVAGVPTLTFAGWGAGKALLKRRRRDNSHD